MEALGLLVVGLIVGWFGWIAFAMLWDMVRNLFRKLPED